jgi:hypothetical protein
MARAPIERFPLHWPTGWKRTRAADRQRARWETTKSDIVTDPATGQRQVIKRIYHINTVDAAARLEKELERLGGENAVLSTNVELRRDGLPRAGRAEPTECGAAVYFRFKGDARVLACDRWNRVADNIAALAAHIDALRRIDRYGVGSLEQAFVGYTALPPTAIDWWLVLDLPRSATLDAVERQHRALAAEHHPDRGGDPHVMAKINAARDAARAEKAPVGVGA